MGIFIASSFECARVTSKSWQNARNFIIFFFLLSLFKAPPRLRVSPLFSFSSLLFSKYRRYCHAIFNPSPLEDFSESSPERAAALSAPPLPSPPSFLLFFISPSISPVLVSLLLVVILGSVSLTSLSSSAPSSSVVNHNPACSHAKAPSLRNSFANTFATASAPPNPPLFSSSEQSSRKIPNTPFRGTPPPSTSSKSSVPVEITRLPPTPTPCAPGRVPFSA
mmetsp:Transcript_8781/g.28800  ORF Transcript_8781/g.28800 Transcript_8781/m.28800 type:complete len:222 (+) Transcript_8781:751-1416(+)